MSRRILITGGSGFIGTHLVEAALAAGDECLNLDHTPPQLAAHRPHWRQVDLLDAAALAREVQSFAPDRVVHLAARTDTTSDDPADYPVNTEGTAHLLAALAGASAATRVIVTSSQFVVGPGAPPRDEFDFRPHTAYGRTKVLTEQLTRQADLPACWTIVRPTNIWGPWHPRYPSEFWAVLRRGLYVHPGRRPVLRCYGYVANVVDQILRILDAPPARVRARVFYLGDAPVELLDWVDGFARAITGGPVRVVPRAAVRGLALGGDLLALFGFRPPIQSSRFRSMTENYLVPMEPTFEALGPPSYTLEQGIDATVRWLTEQGFFDPTGAPEAASASGGHKSLETG